MQDLSLQTRIADFLKQHPPFDEVNENDLIKLAASVRVKYFEKGEYVYKSYDPPGEFVYVVRQGTIEKILMTGGQPKLTDVESDGDIFGVAALITGKPYHSSAFVREEAMLYAIPWKAFFPLFEKFPRVSLFFAAGYAKSMPHIRFGGDEGSGPFSDFSYSDTTHSVFEEDDVFNIQPTRDIISCDLSTTILEAAKIISRENVGSIIVVNEKKYPIGIVTDVDFRKKVVAGEIPLNSKINTVMSSPVITITNGMTAGNIIILMLQNNIRHLVVTKDGTPESESLGVISEHDMLLLHGNNPAILVKEISNIKDISRFPEMRQRAKKLAGQYLVHGTSVQFTTSVMSGINDSIVITAIKISEEKLKNEGFEKPDIKWCWLSLGSQGRGEQLLNTDQDNAILYEDPSEEQAEYVKKYFLKLGEEVTDILKTSGFDYCPSNMMARNPDWCQPLSGWKKHFSKWIREPAEKELMFATIFFDFRPVYGEVKLAQQLREHINSETEHERMFIIYLARNALLNPPPLSFLSNLIVEKSGEHKNMFDIKLRGTMPLADTARVLALDMKIHHITNTIDRYKKVSELDPKLADICMLASSAYELFIKYKTLTGLKYSNDGRYLDPSTLRKVEKNALKNAFRTIEKIHDLLTVRYQLDYIL